MPFPAGDGMEQSSLLSATRCCVCDHALSDRDLREFYSMADEAVRGEHYCRACAGEHLFLCRECSGCYTVAERGICTGCLAREYIAVGEKTIVC